MTKNQKLIEVKEVVCFKTITWLIENYKIITKSMWEKT